MAQRDINLIKKAIYDTMQNDATLISLVGGSSNIRYEKPTKKVGAYPCVVYNILEEYDQPYDEDFATGIAKSVIEIQIFDYVKNSAKTIDTIENRIYTLFHGQSITGGVAGVESFSCYRSKKVGFYEEATGIRRIITNYDYVNYTS